MKRDVLFHGEKRILQSHDEKTLSALIKLHTAQLQIRYYNITHNSLLFVKKHSHKQDDIEYIIKTIYLTKVNTYELGLRQLLDYNRLLK